jgi:hypothetical protein
VALATFVKLQLLLTSAAVSVKPDPSALPGTSALEKLIDGLAAVALLGCVAGVLLGAAQWAIASIPEDAWVGAISQEGVPVAEHPSRPREAYVTELTGLLDLSAWPEGSRLICRRERAHPGAQLSLIDTDGWRHQCFLTDQTGEDVAELDRAHRAHAHVEQRIEDGKALGLAKLPFRSFAMNEAWMQLVLARAKPQTLRYRLLHQPGRLARSGRRARLRLARDWPWAEQLVAACRNLDALPLPAG